VLFVAEVAGN